MIILFEGAEKTGKTQLAQELSKQLCIPYYKDNREKFSEDSFLLNGKGKFSQEISNIYETHYLLQLLRQGIIKNLIIDRGYVSELVYGPLFRKQQFENLNVKSILLEYDKEFSLYDLFIIILFKDNYICYNDEYVTESQNEIVKNSFFNIAKELINPIFFLNTNNLDLEEQIKQIKNFIKK